jgi:hypothetical protein
MTPARILNRDSSVPEVKDYETVRVLGGAVTVILPPPTPTPLLNIDFSVS